MRVLLDTHAFLWFISGDAKLSSQARETIEAATTQRYLSIANLVGDRDQDLHWQAPGELVIHRVH